MKVKRLGRPRVGADARAGDAALRRQHVLRAGHALRRHDARARRRHRHPPARACSCRTPDRPLHILLTHLHLDHIQGLMFFAPMFSPASEIVIWGPAAPEAAAARPHRPLPLARR